MSESLLLTTAESDIKEMIDKASKQIKENAKKRKEEEEANTVNSFGLSLDGKPEKFPFKNIKPKKAFLLGDPDDESENSNSTDDNADGSVNMSSPE